MIRSLSALLAAALVSAAPAAAPAGEVVERIRASGTMTMGFRTDAPPFASLVDGQPAGFSIDLCTLVAGAVKDEAGLGELTARLKPVGTGQRFDALAAGEIDILCGATTATLTRRAQVSFSIPTFVTGVGVALRDDAPALLKEVLVENSPAALSRTVVAEALKGRRIGVRRDTTASDWLASGPLAGIEDVALVPMESHESAIAALRAKDIDAYFADRAILAGAVRAAGDGAALVLSKKTFTFEPYALAIPKGDEEFRLVIDRALSRLYRSGVVLKLVERHFGAPAPDVVLFYQLTALPE